MLSNHEQELKKDLSFISKRAFSILRTIRQNPSCFKASRNWIYLAVKELEKNKEPLLANTLKELLIIQSKLIDIKDS